VLGVAVLVGWAFDVAVLKTVVPGLASMKANTAACLVVCGCSLWLWHREAGDERFIGALLAGAATAVVTVTLLEHASGWDLGIDQVLASDRGAPVGQAPGRMAVNTAIAFVCAGSALTMLWTRPRAARDLAAWLGWAAATIGLLAIVGYSTELSALQRIGPDVPIALHTGCGLLVLGVGVAFAQPAALSVRRLTAPTAGGRLLRWMLPSAVGLPLAFGVVPGLLARSDVVSFDVASWTRAAGMMLLLVIVAIVAARSLDGLEAERDGRESQLRVSEARLRMMIGDVRDYAILMLDTQGMVATWNAGAERFKGYRADEIIGQHFSVFYVPDDIASGKPARELEVAAADGRLEDEGWRVRKDGTRFWANVVITAMRDSDGVLRGYGKITRDLSEREQARIDLEQANRELAESNAQLEQFAYMASHDLAEPLRTITGFSQLLSRRYAAGLDEDAQRFIRHVVDGGRRMQDLIDDLLEFSRAGAVDLADDDLDARDVIDRVIAELGAPIRESGAAIQISTLPRVRGDGALLERVFQNLLTNAIKFGGDSPRIGIAGQATPTGWRFDVSDHGIGIDPKHADRVFEMFERLNRREDYPGTGIGLAICKRIVERHGGRIWLDSTPEQGATVSFTLARSTR
jgi:PAS domain S-box-containing protein